jgi:hypothetical protein
MRGELHRFEVNPQSKEGRGQLAGRLKETFPAGELPAGLYPALALLLSRAREGKIDLGWVRIEWRHDEDSQDICGGVKIVCFRWAQ